MPDGACLTLSAQRTPFFEKSCNSLFARFELPVISKAAGYPSPPKLAHAKKEGNGRFPVSMTQTFHRPSPFESRLHGCSG